MGATWHIGVMLDFHLHVWPHERGTPTPTVELLERYCEAAASHGVHQIAITEHCHRFTRIEAEVLPHWQRPNTGPTAEATAHILEVEGGADLDAYVGALVAAKDAGLPLLIGMEVDHLPGTDAAMDAVLAEYPFDILLGSVHWLDDWLFDAYGIDAFAAVWHERNTDQVWGQYVDAVLELAHSGRVDVLAHLDVIKVAGYLPEHLAALEDRLVAGVVASGVAVEFSSAGLRKPAEAPYPSLRMLDRLVDAGVGLVTASDAHQLDQIGTGYDLLRDELDARNVTELVTFDARRRSPVNR